VPIIITTLSDPLTLVCPPAVDLFEGQVKVPIGANMTIKDSEPVPGASDADSEVSVEIIVGDGSLHVLPELLPQDGKLLEELEVVLNGTSLMPNKLNPTILPGMAFFNFNTTLTGLRAVFRGLAFTPFPELYHGVVHLEIRVSAAYTDEEERCEIGLVVHPVNSAPVIHVNQARLMASTGGGVVTPHKDINMAGVIQLSDPDEEDYSGGWFMQRVHSARLKLRVSCGTMSFAMFGEPDYVSGVQNGSIAGIEGVTFHAGDGSHDTDMDITSTLENLNQQLMRLYYHSGADCRDTHITIWAELDDLGNYGAGNYSGDFGHPLPIVVYNEVHFDVANY